MIALGLDAPAAAVDRLLEDLRDRLRHRRAIGYIAARRQLRQSAGLWVLDRTAPGSLTRNFYRDLRRMDRRQAPLIFVEAVAAGDRSWIGCGEPRAVF